LLGQGAGGRSRAHVRLVSLLLLALLLFLLLGGSRVGAAGRGLGQAAHHIKRAIQEDVTPAASSPPALAMNEPAESTIKLLPAKGQTSGRSEEP